MDKIVKRNAKFTIMETKLFAWFLDERAKDHPLSRRMILSKAQELVQGSKEGENQVFKSSSSWFYGFCRRHKISRRKITHTLQRLPDDFKKKIEQFSEDLNKAKNKISTSSGNDVNIIYGKFLSIFYILTCSILLISKYG